MILICLCVMCGKAYAFTDNYDIILDEMIKSEGVFDGRKGVVYAEIAGFEYENSLLTVTAKDDTAECAVYDDIDGIQLTDVLKIPLNGMNFILSSAENGGKTSVVLSSGGKQKFYTISNDTFCESENMTYTSKTDIINVKNGKIRDLCGNRRLYNLLNGLKRHRIERSGYLNVINTIDESDKNDIRRIAAACADIMKFDVRDFSYDSLVKYILCTNRNFGILTDIEPGNSEAGEEISIVREEYIDYVLENVFGVQPEHAAVNALSSRGFCVDNGYYYYKNIFDGFYATDIIDIEAIYDLGEDVYYTVFSDIYRQGDSAAPEYSYAVVKKTDKGYRMLKLGMGERLLDDEELQEFSAEGGYKKYAWNNTADVKESFDGGLYAALFLVCLSCGTTAAVCGVIFAVSEARGKRKY